MSRFNLELVAGEHARGMVRTIAGWTAAGEAVEVVEDFRGSSPAYAVNGEPAAPAAALRAILSMDFNRGHTQAWERL